MFVVVVDLAALRTCRCERSLKHKFDVEIVRLSKCNLPTISRSVRILKLCAAVLANHTPDLDFAYRHSVHCDWLALLHITTQLGEYFCDQHSESER